MPSPSARFRRVSFTVAAAVLATATTTSAFTAFAADSSDPAAAAASTTVAAPSSFHGVNWADPRDNYAPDAVVPSGLSVTDNYGTVYRKTQKTVAGFRENLGANTLRLPINPASVGTAWWNS